MIYNRHTCKTNCNLLWSLLALLATSFLPLKAQYFNKTIDLNQRGNVAWSIEKIEDGLLIWTGSICTGTLPCVGLLKTDFDGNVLWIRIIEGFKPPTANSMIVDNGYMYIIIQHNEPVADNIKIMKIDVSDGNTLQEWDLGSTQENELPFGLLRYQQGFIIYSVLFPPDHEEIAWLIFTDSIFNPIRELFFDEETHPYGLILAKDLMATPDGNLLATRRSGSVGFAVGNITQFDSLGNVAWQHLLPLSQSGSGTNEVHITQLQDGGYAVNGFRDQPWSSGNYEYPPAIFKLDTEGMPVWEYTFLTPRYDRKRVWNLRTAANGDIIGAGYRKFYRDDLERYVNCGWMFRMDASTGAVVWDRTLCYYHSPIYDMAFRDAAELSNGDLVFTGLYQDTFPDHIPFINDPNVWLVRVGADGCLVEGCNGWTVINADGSITATETPVADQSRFIVYPNPGRGQVWIATEGEAAYGKSVHLLLYDIQGRQVKMEGWNVGPPQYFDWGDLLPGMYFYQIQIEGLSPQNGKIVMGR